MDNLVPRLLPSHAPKLRKDPGWGWSRDTPESGVFSISVLKTLREEWQRELLPMLSNVKINKANWARLLPHFYGLVENAECGVRSVLFTVANHFNIGLRIFHRAGGLGGKRGVCLKTFVYGCKPF